MDYSSNLPYVYYFKTEVGHDRKKLTKEVQYRTCDEYVEAFKTGSWWILSQVSQTSQLCDVLSFSTVLVFSTMQFEMCRCFIIFPDNRSGIRPLVM